MRIVLTLAFFLLLLCAGCEQYSTGIQQTVARADETVVISALRTVAVAQRAYSVSNEGNFGTFEQLVEGGYLDQRFNSAKPMLKDYSLSMAVTPKSSSQPDGFYSCSADPQGTGEAAGRHYYIDSTSTDIHVNAKEPATAKDETVH